HQAHHLDAQAVDEDLVRALRGQVLPAGDDPIFDRRSVAARLLEQAEPGDGGGQRTTRRAAQPHDLESTPDVVSQERLQRSRDEGALAAAALTCDRDTLSTQSFPFVEGLYAV